MVHTDKEAEEVQQMINSNLYLCISLAMTFGSPEPCQKQNFVSRINLKIASLQVVVAF